MSTQPEQVEVEFYLTLVPEWSRHLRDANKRPILTGVKADKITKTRPDMVRGGGLVTKVGIVVDAAAFVPLQPEAVIHISTHDVTVIQDAQAEAPEPLDLEPVEHDYDGGTP